MDTYIPRCILHNIYNIYSFIYIYIYIYHEYIPKYIHKTHIHSQKIIYIHQILKKIIIYYMLITY